MSNNTLQLNQNNTNATVVNQYDNNTITIVLIGKEQVGSNPFFEFVRNGCESEAKKLSTTDDDNGDSTSSSSSSTGGRQVRCVYDGPIENKDALEQAILMRRYIQMGKDKVQGIALAALDETISKAMIDEAMNAGIPVITFDSDVPDSQRIAYVGTNNYAFGQALGKLVVQLMPKGGTYALISSTSPNLQKRVQGVRDYLHGIDTETETATVVAATSPSLRGIKSKSAKGVSATRYIEVSNSPADTLENNTLALEQVDAFASQGDPLQVVDAIIPVAGWPMYDYEAWRNVIDKHMLSSHDRSTNNKNLTLVVGDTFPVQVQALQSGHVHGLVGQDPYKMGAMCMKLLFEHCCSTSGTSTPPNAMANNTISTLDSLRTNHTTTSPAVGVIYGTEFLEMVRVPLTLPELDVNQNQLGNLRILGFAFFAIIACISILMAIWTFVKRNVRVVVVSQPGFLVMICFGVLVFGSTLIPMSFDDSMTTTPFEPNEKIDRMCMAVPWLASLGFTIIFAALFSKIWRINKIFKNPHPYKRMKVTQRDLYLPLLVLSMANIINLTLWTILSPLEFKRYPHVGSDGWNRVISTYGTCTTASDKNSTPFVVVMALINGFAVIIANWQAYEARTIRSEFSESKFIAIAMVAVLQALVSGVPILFLVRDLPEAYYVVLATMFFVISVVILSLVFIPKILAERKYSADVLAQQKKHVSDSMAQIKEKRFKFTSTYANDGSRVDEIEEAKANHRDSGYSRRSRKNQNLAQEILEEDEEVPTGKRRFRKHWPRQDMKFKNDEDGMRLERHDFESLGSMRASSETGISDHGDGLTKRTPIRNDGEIEASQALESKIPEVSNGSGTKAILPSSPDGIQHNQQAAPEGAVLPNSDTTIETVRSVSDATTVNQNERCPESPPVSPRLCHTAPVLEQAGKKSTEAPSS